ncbi:MAG: hypothetical protein JKY90_00640 [Gammaproteobacteria bacterium]|nr:hypothetical protein [Gammaproteobacteria bacterium]
MLNQRLIGTLGSIFIATMATISPAQAEHQRHTNPTVAIIAGAAIVTAGYLAYKHNYRYAKPHYNSHRYKQNRHHKKHQRYGFSHKKKYIQRRHYSNDHIVKHYRGNRYDSHYGNKHYSYKKRYYRDSHTHNRYCRH